MVRHGTILLVCPVRNEAGYISKLISSLQNQTYSNWILHIRDNCSTDATVSILRAFQSKDERIRITSSQAPDSVHVSALHAINEALLTASDFVSFIAGDDYYESSTHLESLLTALDDVSTMCALPQFRLFSDVIDIYMPTKASPKSMRRNHFRLAASGAYVCSIYGLFKRVEFERILKTRSGRLPTAWEPSYDYWFALEALRNAQSVKNETYMKFVKGIDHTSSYYNPDSEVANLSRKPSTKLLAMICRQLFETFVDPFKHFLSGYKRISRRDLLWIPLFLFIMIANRFSHFTFLSIKFLLKLKVFQFKKIAKKRGL
jgi:glycosyltransferase involved in cell wall biosynthesis